MAVNFFIRANLGFPAREKQTSIHPPQPDLAQTRLGRQQMIRRCPRIDQTALPEGRIAAVSGCARRGAFRLRVNSLSIVAKARKACASLSICGRSSTLPFLLSTM